MINLYKIRSENIRNKENARTYKEIVKNSSEELRDKCIIANDTKKQLEESMRVSSGKTNLHLFTKLYNIFKNLFKH